MVDVNGSVGPFLVGSIVGAFLCGMTITQSYTYFKTFGRDRLAYRIAVAVLLALDVLHTIFAAVTAYWFCVTYFGEPEKLATSPWTFALSPIMTGASALITQSFYAYRIYGLSGRKYYLPGLIIVLSATQFGFAAGATGQIFALQLFSRFQSWTYGVLAWLLTAVVADICVTASLSLLLLNSKQDNEFAQTNSFIDRIIRNTMETNFITLIVALADAICFAVLSSSWHVFPNLLLTKLYLNSVLVSLNARTGFNQSGSSVSKGGSGGGHGDTGIDLAVRSQVANFVSVTSATTVHFDDLGLQDREDGLDSNLKRSTSGF